MFSFYTELGQNQDSWCIELISPALGLVFSFPCLIAMSPVSRATDIGRRDEEAREIRGSNPAYLPPSSMPVRLDNGHRQEIEDGKVIQKYARGTEILKHVAFWAILPE